MLLVGNGNQCSRSQLLSFPKVERFDEVLKTVWRGVNMDYIEKIGALFPGENG